MNNDQAIVKDSISNDDAREEKSGKRSDSASDAAAPRGPSREEAIRRAAHRRYEVRGGADGDEVQDWLDAEAEVDRAEDSTSSAG